MNKLAIFVEGQTELLFVERLFQEIASLNQLDIECFGATGPRVGPIRMQWLRKHSSASSTHYVQIVDCRSDGHVKPYILDRYPALVRSNFWTAIGLRDVYPLPPTSIATLRANLAHGIPKTPVDTQFILAVMEVEAWFIAEHSHFTKLNPKLTLPNIVSVVGYDPSTADVQQCNNPASDLRLIYQSVGHRYTKRQSNCLRTIENLDFAQIYCELPTRFPDFAKFIGIIDSFLALP